MLCQSHIIHIGFLRAGIRQKNGIIPESEIIDSVITFCHRKEGLSVIAFHSGHQIKLPIQVNGTGIKHTVDAQTLLKKGIGPLVQIILPDNGRMLSGQYWINISVIDTVVKALIHFVFSGQELFLFFL